MDIWVALCKKHQRTWSVHLVGEGGFNSVVILIPFILYIHVHFSIGSRNGMRSRVHRFLRDTIVSELKVEGS